MPKIAKALALPAGLPIYEVKAQLFKALGHPARVRILEVLADGERSVARLLPEVGLEPSHLSQQLAVLKRANLVGSRKEGVTVFYSIKDTKIVKLLAVAKAILLTSLRETSALLSELS